MSTIAELFAARAGDGAPALRDEESAWSWAEVVSATAARAGALQELRQPGPFHIGVLMENVAEYVFVLGGAALAGAVIVGINPTRRGAELESDIRHTDCQVILTDGAQVPLLAGLDVPPALLVDGDDYQALVARHIGDPLPSTLPVPEDLYLLMFTSGSTGAPKAVRMSQGRAARTAGASARAFGPDDVLYCSMPLFHGNALLANLFPGVAAGATVAIRRRFSASAFLPDIQQHGATFFNYVGRALSYIVALPASPAEADNRLKWGLGSEASARDIAEFTRRYGCPIFEGYGSSENAVIIQPGANMPAGAMGKPQAGLDVTVVDPATGSECPTAIFAEGVLTNAGAAIGEIVGRNCASRFEGYYNNPTADAERARGDWYWSGDLGYRDADGWFYFAGRAADWLRVDGENFSAAPVERILSRGPGVDGVVVFGVPDAVTGDQVMAAVEGSFDPVSFAEFLSVQTDLGTKWAPRYIRLVDSLPVTATGKVDKKPLRADRWQSDDPVWWRPPGADAYRLLTDDDREAIFAAFVANGRAGLLA